MPKVNVFNLTPQEFRTLQQNCESLDNIINFVNSRDIFKRKDYDCQMNTCTQFSSDKLSDNAGKHFENTEIRHLGQWALELWLTDNISGTGRLFPSRLIQQYILWVSLYVSLHCYFVCPRRSNR